MKRGPIERYLIRNGYNSPVPHAWLDTFNDDDDAFLASVQNLDAGGKGVWYDSKGRRDKERSEPLEYDPTAHADALRDMEADRAS